MKAPRSNTRQNTPSRKSNSIHHFHTLAFFHFCNPNIQNDFRTLHKNTGVYPH